MAYYEAVVRPWLWFLGNTTDCRIFQNMSVVEIVEDIFSKYGIAKFEKRLQGSYPPREYCVQYDETDLDFVQRLLEHEGIFYFFEHDDGEHTLMLVDAMSKLKPAPGYDKVPFHMAAAKRGATSNTSPNGRRQRGAARRLCAYRLRFREARRRPDGAVVRSPSVTRKRRAKTIVIRARIAKSGVATR